jgi:nucleoside phosphorylase
MPCAVIVTALRVEYLAVRTHLRDLTQEKNPQGKSYERGKFAANATSWEVGIVEVGDGNPGAEVETERAILYFQPDILFFVGIAGGIKDVAIGDVVAATKVYNYESGKVEGQFLTRPALVQSNYALVETARAEARKEEWLKRLANSPASQPYVFLAPIAAGEKVIASRQSEVFQLLRRSYNDAIAVEMEGFGFLSAAFPYRNIQAIVIRGISDLVEGKNDDSVETEQIRHEKASRHASAFAFEMLAKTLIYETQLNQQLIERLQLKFQQLENGWLSNRYSPDLHQTGQIETDLHLRLNCPSSVWLEEVRQIRALLEDVHLAILRLRRYPEFMQRHDAEDLISSAEKWIMAAIAEQQELESRIVPGKPFPLPDFEREVTDEDAPWQLIRIIDPDKKHSSESPTADIGKQLEATLNRWYDRKVTPRYLQSLGQPAAYIGEPGVGKTHALANAVHIQLAAGKPAILIRAKNLDLARSWDVILAEAIGMSGSNINQVLDALEAAAILVENSRVLIAIDGLDETPKAEQWAEKLGELTPLAKKYPKVLFACSLRTNLFDRIALPNGIDSVHLSGSDATLGEIFKSYCKVNRIECPPILRWALQTPLAIRLFADLYKEKYIDINAVTLQDFSLAKLIDRKINHAERAIRENDPQGWSENITPVRDTLRAIVKACLSKGKLLPKKALKKAKKAQQTPGILSCRQLLNILEKCRDRGLLLLSSQPSNRASKGNIILWEPAYETITDFLLAEEAHNAAKMNPNNPEMPAYLMYRGNAITLAAYLLGMDGYDFFTTGLWSNNLSIKEREELRLTTILMMPPDQGENYRTWVIEIFKRNMPSCRKVLDRLVIPGLRIPGYLYGSQFVHDVLLPMQVAERDFFWSGPDDIQPNHEAPWEGFGEPVLDELKIADDDAWDTAPLLLAWATTTVKNDSRRRIRGEIAVWGSRNPDGLLALLKKACQTNDPQMQEDILSAAYGASCLTRPDEKWLPLCDWLIDNFFVPNAPLYTHNIVVRHSARSIIERCVSCHIAIDAERLISVHTPYIESEEILCIDKDAAIHVDPHWGIQPVTGDLAWYVVPRVIKSFFERYQFTKTNRTKNQINNEAASNFDDIDEKLLRSFVEGYIRKSAKSESRRKGKNILKKIVKNQSTKVKSRKGISEETYQLIMQRLTQPSEALSEENFFKILSQREYSPSAQVFLSKYSAAYEISDLSPTQFAFGFVVAYIAELGWSRENFIKEPNGGEPGEILGADIAILREYPQATHGSRSTTATFGEKYVWAATHELSGFLADRVAVYDWNRCFEPPVDLSLLAEPTNPASDVGYGQLKLHQVLDFSELVPDTELSEFDQVDRANEWVQKAPLPNYSSLLLHKSAQLPEWARNDEWIVLRSFVIRRNADSQAESALRASSFLFPSNASPLLEEDAQFGILPELNEFCSGVASVESYRDPCEVVWAPWIEEIEGLIGHKTLDAIGNPIELQLQATTCQFHWKAPDGDNEAWVPGKALREMLGIVDFREGQFLTASGQIQAFTCNNRGESWHTRACQVLLVRRTALFEALAERNLSIGWGIWLNREPAYPLITISDKTRMFRNRYTIALWSADNFKFIPYKDCIEPWYKDDDLADVTPKS